jgi:hypothetical protein
MMVGPLWLRSQTNHEKAIPGRTQWPHDCPATASWLPQPMRQALDSQQRLDGNARRLIEVLAALGK